MEFYPDNLIREYPQVELESAKPAAKFNAMKASTDLADDPIDKYFKWN
jgi:hypothetical protein